MSKAQAKLCGVGGCRRLAGHDGAHARQPTEVWSFMEDKDQKKLEKTSYATPRGGAKGAYQNHVLRTSRVIVPFERLSDVDLNMYGDYIVRLLPEQFFSAAGVPKVDLASPIPLKVGENAFVLYRTHKLYRDYPPMAGWQVRRMYKDDVVVKKRTKNVVDKGHYVLRMSKHGADPRAYDGAPQGIFATEYADEDVTFLSQCVLAWLIIYTHGSPYVAGQEDAQHLRAILESENLCNAQHLDRLGALRQGISSCPLCLRRLSYNELHEIIGFDEALSLENAAIQVEGATRSTIVNLFHLEPLSYRSLVHIPENVAWGHAICNTRLGQRRCVPLAELIESGYKIGILHKDEVESIGWMSQDWQMIRSPDGAVWIQLNGNIEEAAPVDPIFDEAAIVPEDFEEEDGGDEELEEG